MEQSNPFCSRIETFQLVRRRLHGKWGFLLGFNGEAVQELNPFMVVLKRQKGLFFKRVRSKGVGR